MAVDSSGWVELAIAVVSTVIGWLTRHFGIGAPKS